MTTLPIVVWRCPYCRLLSESGGHVPHLPGCVDADVNGLRLEAAYVGRAVTEPAPSGRATAPSG